MRLTKLDMARVIAMALYNKQDLPPVNSREVQKWVRSGTVASLTRQYDLAIKAIESRAHGEG